jgi:hypothetical protein
MIPWRRHLAGSFDFLNRGARSTTATCRHTASAHAAPGRAQAIVEDHEEGGRCLWGRWKRVFKIVGMLSAAFDNDSEFAGESHKLPRSRIRHHGDILLRRAAC